MAGSIFLTGATGFLGSRLLAQLAGEADRTVVCLHRSTVGSSHPANVKFVQGELLDPASYSHVLVGCDAVIHLAAATGKQAACEYFRVNRDGTEALVQEARRAGVHRFLFVSTIGVNFPDKSHYPYAASKQEAEAIVRQSGLCWTIVRPAIILGRNAPVLEGFSRLAALPLVPVFGDGKTPIQPVSVDDLSACLIEILNEEQFRQRTIEIGGPEVLSIDEFLQRLRKARGGRRARLLHLPAGPIAACLGWVEPVLRPVLPLTAGQVATFTNPGTAAPDPWVAKRQGAMKGVDAMLKS